MPQTKLGAVLGTGRLETRGLKRRAEAQNKQKRPDFEGTNLRVRGAEAQKERPDFEGTNLRVRVKRIEA